MRFETSFFEGLRYCGTMEAVGMLFGVVCTSMLVMVQIRGCLRPQRPRPARDMAFLISGPVMAILLSLCRAASATMAFMAGGIDADFGLRYGLNDVLTLCGVGSFCFIIGGISLCLPTLPFDATDARRKPPPV